MKNVLLKTFYKQRAEFNEMTAARDKTLIFPEDISEYRDIPYMGDGDKAHCLDIFRSKGRTGEALPVIVDVHGGGMILGNKEFNRHFCAQICSMGYLVFCVEVRSVPEVRIFEQYEDLSRAMDYIKEIVPQYNGDLQHVYAVADSGGANLLTYAIAMKKVDALAEAAGVTPTTLDVKALGLISGMFYTTKFDKIGLCMPDYLYGKGYKKSAFAPYTNPEHPEIVSALPPCYLVTSQNDNLQHYTLNFEKALTRHGVPHKLVNYPENKRMTHAFSVFEPFWEKSIDATAEMLDFLKQY
ncbi:MAG: alpha/beta hydrolase [Lachnospiraceae bacterium]|nr:alpha/beta hydrolase [Lachnospiraceae bacterium]